MIQVTAQMRILLSIQPADFRCGIDGLARVCRDELQSDPMSGAIFVFRNRRKTSVKLLCYDGQGFWLMLKRLSTGRFRWWPQSPGERASPLEAHQLQVLLWNGNPEHADVAPAWRSVAATG
ncbi:IS66 family insertion sequence element accessory protein TnpB [Candidatus Fermentibacteria bacterium]|nr:IS66 family insertion sequence element accessory protein TnpB [Candidatus Fermentibacteria bacterium]